MAKAKNIQSKEDELDHDKRVDWEINHELISNSFYDIVLKKKKMPTYEELARVTGLNRKTITRHFEDPEILNSTRMKLRALRDKAMLTVAIKAITGKSVSWSKLFLEATESELVTKKIDVQSGGEKINSQNLSDAQFEKLLTKLNGKTATHKS